jgi:hypothetical protein
MAASGRGTREGHALPRELDRSGRVFGRRAHRSTTCRRSSSTGARAGARAAGLEPVLVTPEPAAREGAFARVRGVADLLGLLG